MDFDSSSKFIASLAKFLQSLCNGYVEFDKGVEVIGHIYLSVDSDTGKKVDYVLNEKVCKNDNSVTFISNSFHAQPAEKPKPLPKKNSDKQDEDTIIMDESGQSVPSSTNVGTIGPYRNMHSARGVQDTQFSPGSKRPRSPPRRIGMGKNVSSPGAAKHGMPSSPRFQDSGGPSPKIGRSDIPQSPMNNNAASSQDYDGANVFQSGGDEEDNFLADDQNATEIDQKPIIDPDISIVKEEYMANQSSCAYSGSNQTSGPGRGKSHPSNASGAFPVMLHSNPSGYSSGGPGSHQSDLYGGSTIEGMGDPSGLTRAQQEELEMYYRKGTDQHLTFLRNMREAHAMYPFTGKRDKELFDKALAELFLRMPILCHDALGVESLFYANTMKKMSIRRCRDKNKSQFKSPGQGQRLYGQRYHGGPGGYPGGYPNRPMHGMDRRMSMGGLESGDSFLHAPGDDSYDYQPGASDDSRDTQHSTGEGSNPQQQGFHGAFVEGTADPQSYEHQETFSQDQQQHQQGNGNAAGSTAEGEGGGGGGSSGQPQSPPDIKYEVTPMPFMKTDDFELIEIDPDEEDDI